MRRLENSYTYSGGCSTAVAAHRYSTTRYVHVPVIRIFVGKTIWVPIGRYGLFHKTGKPVRASRDVITSPIYRTFVDEATVGYDIKDDLVREVYVKVAELLPRS